MGLEKSASLYKNFKKIDLILIKYDNIPMKILTKSYNSK